MIRFIGCSLPARVLRASYPKNNRLITVANFHSCIRLSKNEPKYDDAEIIGKRLTKDNYVGKRDKSEYRWDDKPNALAEKEYIDRMEKLAKIYAVFQGVLLLLGVGAAGTAYMMWPQIKGWWLSKDIRVSDDVIEKLKEKKERKKLEDIPVVPDETPDSSVPGLYYWGKQLDGDSNNSSVSKFPLRVPFFNDKALRDVALADTQKYGNLAIDKDGNLFQWDLNRCELILKDQNLVTVKISNDVAYALNKSGDILVIPLNDSQARLSRTSSSRSLLLPWKKYTKYSWKLDTKSALHYPGERRVTYFDVGSNHLVLLSNAGKAYTCSTGVKTNPDERSKGQFGIPNFSQFDPYPTVNKLYEIELLNKGITGDHITSRYISKVACGDYHTLAIDSNGELFSFGLNTYGQLGQNISYDMEYVPFPKKVSTFSGHFDKQSFLKCVDIHCSGDTSYVVISSQDILQLFKRDRPLAMDEQSDITYFAFGNGIQGQLGNGHFKHSQSDPTKMKIINDFKDSNAKVADWYCGGQHTFVKLKNGEVMCWGSNDCGQLGNGKKIKYDKPKAIPKLIEPGEHYDSKNVSTLYDEKNKLVLSNKQEIRAGKHASCLFWKA